MLEDIFNMQLELNNYVFKKNQLKDKSGKDLNMQSIMAAVKKHSDISVGNLIGSNIFNIMGVLGITSMIKEIFVSNQVVSNDMYWVLAISLLVFPLMIIVEPPA